MSKAVIIGAAFSYEPSREHLDRPKIVVAAGDASAASPQFGQVVKHAAGRDILNAFESAPLNNRSRPLQRRGHIVGCGTLVNQVCAVVFQVLRQQLLTVGFERIRNACSLAFDLANNLIQHRLSGRLVTRQRDSTLAPQGISITPPPLPRFLLDLLASLWIGHDDRFLV
ncbi:MAG: hypothetical protein PHN77_13735 [Thermoguttaceae bacterium]|nr:hypothetical protein [Thermoguttaceae bacterium]